MAAHTAEKKIATTNGVHMIINPALTSDYEGEYVKKSTCCIQYEGIPHKTPIFAVPRIDQWETKEEDKFMEWCNEFSTEIWWLIKNFGDGGAWLQMHRTFWHSYKKRWQTITQLLDTVGGLGAKNAGSVIVTYLY